MAKYLNFIFKQKSLANLAFYTDTWEKYNREKRLATVDADGVVISMRKRWHHIVKFFSAYFQSNSSR